MLQTLSIRNLSLVDEAAMEFGDGLNIITGETGAGKSILIGALSFLLGEKSAVSTPFDGANKAVVEGHFKMKMTPTMRVFLEERDLAVDEEALILRREVHPSGRTRTFVNDSPVAAEALEQLSDWLVDLHGQHEHQSLLRSRTHLFFLDAYGDLDARRQQVMEIYRQWRAAETALAEARHSQQQAQEKQDLFVFQLQEIDTANPSIDEDQTLELEEKLLASGEKRFELASRLSSLLYENEGSVHEQLGAATSTLRELAATDPALEQLRGELESAALALGEVAKMILDYARHVDINPARLETVRQRLAELQRLKKKYGGSLEALLRRRQELHAAVNQQESLQEEISKLSERLVRLGEELMQKCLALSEARQRVAKQLEQEVPPLLSELGMPSVQFEVQIERLREEDGRPKLGPEGMEHIEFLFSANPGRSVAPLARIASGGELSRVMLALKSVLAEKDSVPVIVFDEIDSGVSGRIAQAVGRKLHQLAASHQIICVTHLPQIASAGRHHFLVEKSVRRRETRTTVRKLRDTERPEAIARLLGGENITETHLQSARELLAEAKSAGGNAP
jgi:DNA repair protein RecN (Recombination protein N)